MPKPDFLELSRQHVREWLRLGGQPDYIRARRYARMALAMRDCAGRELDPDEEHEMRRVAAGELE